MWACERGVFLNAGENPVEFSFAGGRFSVIAFVVIFMDLNVFRTDCCYAHGLFDLFLFLMVCSWVV